MVTTAAAMESHAKRVNGECSLSEFMRRKGNGIRGVVPALP
jgi:hypothetical protein